MKRRTAKAGLVTLGLVGVGLFVVWVWMFPPEAAHVRADVPPVSGAGLTIRVMSFNILNGKSDLHLAAWDKRRAAVARCIRDFGPDLLGTQEVLDFQAEYLQSQLPGYGFVGVGRDDGKAKGEREGIFYRLDRFEKVREGHFWLSTTCATRASGPRTPGPTAESSACSEHSRRRSSAMHGSSRRCARSTAGAPISCSSTIAIDRTVATVV